MEVSIINRQQIDRPYLHLTVQVTPRSAFEVTALKNLEEGTATFDEQEYINNFFLFNTNLPYQILQIVEHKGNFMTLKAASV